MIARHIVRTTPWATLIAGSVTGTGLLAAMTYVAATHHWPLSQDAVRLAILPVVAALAFVPRDPFRPMAETAPLPAWLTSAGQILLALPVVAVTCFAQLRLMNYTIARLQHGTTAHAPAIYPLIAQLVGWCALALAAAACCDRSRYAGLTGAVAGSVSFVLFALARYAPRVDRLFDAPPATAHAVTAAWYIVAAAATALLVAALRDRWQRYTRILASLSTKAAQKG
jgi:hypothetical protein